MCQFCVEHGEGKRWYLQAKNYAFDLQSDMERHGYVVEFVRGFDEMRARAITAGEVLAGLPRPIKVLGANMISKNMQKQHFGQPIPLEDCAEVLDIATSITVIPCICRMHEPNRTAEEVCVLVSTKPITDVVMEGFADYDGGPDLDDFRTLTKQDAMALLLSCEERGLLHSIWTFHTPFTAAICNCNLASGCMAMKLTTGYGIKLMWRGEDVAVLDSNRCISCRECERVCPFGAFSVESGRVTHHAERCWGCGICRTACVQDAIKLVDRRTVPALASLW